MKYSLKLNLKQVYKRIIVYLKRKQKEQDVKESLDLLMKLIFVDKSTVESIQLKKNFDKQFDTLITLRQKENNYTNKVIDSYFKIPAKKVKTVKKIK